MTYPGVALMVRYRTLRGRGAAVTPSCYAYFRAWDTRSERVPPRRDCVSILLRGTGEFVEQRRPRPVRATRQPGCRFEAAADAGPAAGKIRHRLGTKLAVSGAAFDRHRAVFGGVLGRIMAGAPLRGARRGPRPVRAIGVGRAVSPCQV